MGPERSLKNDAGVSKEECLGVSYPLDRKRLHG
jgi:hypothetical protein